MQLKYLIKTNWILDTYYFNWNYLENNMKSIRNRLNNYARYIFSTWNHLECLILTIYIEPTNHCVLKCKYCLHGIGMKRKKGFMDLSLYKKILNDIRGKIKTIYLLGQGEPLLHKHLPIMIKYTKQNEKVKWIYNLPLRWN